ncbi:aspartate aminotransferase, partial [Blastocystis sp. ATCC 50177/Nand II]
DAIKAAGCGVIFDCAYQGFASGDMEGDAYAIRLFVEEGHQVCLAQSFAKNFGLYGERCGAASVVCASKEEKERVVSQLKVAARTLWSNPPLYGARIVQTVLGDPKLKAQWYEECAGMAKRIISMRAALVENLKKAGSTRDWSHITSQIGMFAYTGLTKAQVERCIKEYHIYLTMNGRISIAGLNTHNVEYVAKAFHEVTKN